MEKRFCPECGQENVETRQPFYYLFTHYVEDFLHYDSRFWKTILYLLFRPAKLTKEYLAGKRKRYVPPVTLYIFISFITFFIPAILPDSKSKEKKKESENQRIITEEQGKNNNRDHSARFEEQEKNDSKENSTEPNVNLKMKNVSKDKLTKLEEQIEKFDTEKWLERIKHDFPKAIFLYMPVFAFWLWLFHSKKERYYFDHGIYTLHYFSFILLSILLYIIIEWLLSFFHFKTSFVGQVIPTAMVGYFIYYFFHSHRLVYRETKAISRLKCSFLFFINTICMIVFLLLYVTIEMFITDSYIIKELLSVIKGEN